jgi:hypothetical protein
MPPGNPLRPPITRRQPPAAPRPAWSLSSWILDDLQTARPGSWLVLLSLLDLIVTYALLQRGIGAYEANPVANWWFRRWNVAGLTIYKFLLIGLIVTICEIIERHRPRLGQAVLWVGCAGALAVAFRGLQLYARH